MTARPANRIGREALRRAGKGGAVLRAAAPVIADAHFLDLRRWSPTSGQVVPPACAPSQQSSTLAACRLCAAGDGMCRTLGTCWQGWGLEWPLEPPGAKRPSGVCYLRACRLPFIVPENPNGRKKGNQPRLWGTRRRNPAAAFDVRSLPASRCRHGPSHGSECDTIAVQRWIRSLPSTFPKLAASPSGSSSARQRRHAPYAPAGRLPQRPGRWRALSAREHGDQQRLLAAVPGSARSGEVRALGRRLPWSGLTIPHRAFVSETGAAVAQAAAVRVRSQSGIPPRGKR